MAMADLYYHTAFVAADSEAVCAADQADVLQGADLFGLTDEEWHMLSIEGIGAGLIDGQFLGVEADGDPFHNQLDVNNPAEFRQLYAPAPIDHCAPTGGRKDLTLEQVCQLIQPIYSTIRAGVYNKFIDNGMFVCVGRKRLVQEVRAALLPGATPKENEACRHRVKCALEPFIYGDKYSTGALPLSDDFTIVHVLHKIALAVAGYRQ